MKTLKLGIAAAFCAACFAGNALAMSVSPNTYTASTTTCSETADVEKDAHDCWGLATDTTAPGNPNAQNVNLNIDFFVDDGGTVEGLFGFTDWTEFQTNTDVGGDSSGSINVVANSYENVVVLLKSANTFAAYLFKDGLQGELEFWTANSSGLSNYVIAGRGEMSDIPLPAAGWLLIAGLGGLAAMKRRKS